jgi:hypothetical protein
METQWIVLCPDGRHSTLVRHREPDVPDEQDIAQSRNVLGAAKQPAWLAIMKGGYYVRDAPDLLMVRPLGKDPGSWEQASAAFEAIRRTVIWPSP